MQVDALTKLSSGPRVVCLLNVDGRILCIAVYGRVSHALDSHCFTSSVFARFKTASLAKSFFAALLSHQHISYDPNADSGCWKLLPSGSASEESMHANAWHTSDSVFFFCKIKQLLFVFIRFIFSLFPRVAFCALLCLDGLALYA